MEYNKRIDPVSLMSEFIYYFIKTKTDTLTWIEMQRGLSDYQNTLKRMQSVAFMMGQVNDPYTFMEERIEGFLVRYDETEKKLGEEYIALLTWLKQHYITLASIRSAVDLALNEKRDSITEMVQATNNLAKDILNDCDVVNYNGDSRAYLETLEKQTPVQVISMLIAHY